MTKPGFDIFDREPLAYEGLTDNQKRCVDHLRDENLQARNKVMHLQAQIEERKQEKADLIRTLAVKQSEINQLKADNDTLRQMAQTFSGWYVNAAEESETLEADKKNLEYEVSILSEQVVLLTDTLKTREKELGDVKNSDKLTVTVNAEHIKSELDSLYQEFKELEGMYDGLADEHRELKEHIKGHVEALANYYTFKEISRGGALHRYHDFREIAEAVGARIPEALLVTARIKAPNVLGDSNNAKVKDLDADKITANAYIRRRKGN